MTFDPVAGFPGAGGRRAAGRTPIVIGAGGTSATFIRVGDRWAHRVFVAGRTGAWQSLEGDRGPAGSAPPVITDVSLVGDGGALQALVGVGHAGSGHCSLAVTVAADHPATLCFEVACRLSRPWPGLGSAYARVAGDRHPAAVQGDEGLSHGEAAAGPETVLLSARIDEAIQPPCTVVWRYRIGPEGIAIVSGARLHGPGD